MLAKLIFQDHSDQALDWIGNIRTSTGLNFFIFSRIGGNPGIMNWAQNSIRLSWLTLVAASQRRLHWPIFTDCSTVNFAHHFTLYYC